MRPFKHSSLHYRPYITDTVFTLIFANMIDISKGLFTFIMKNKSERFSENLFFIPFVSWPFWGTVFSSNTRPVDRLIPPTLTQIWLGEILLPASRGMPIMHCHQAINVVTTYNLRWNLYKILKLRNKFNCCVKFISMNKRVTQKGYSKNQFRKDFEEN